MTPETGRFHWYIKHASQQDYWTGPGDHMAQWLDHPRDAQPFETAKQAEQAYAWWCDHTGVASVGIPVERENGQELRT